MKLRNDNELNRIATLSGSQRTQALVALLDQLTEPLPARVERKLPNVTSTLHERRYYELIAQQYGISGVFSFDLWKILTRYVFAAHTVVGLEACFYSLWSNDAFASLFAATMYRWLFDNAAAQLNRNFIIFLKGVNRLFW